MKKLISTLILFALCISLFSQGKDNKKSPAKGMNLESQLIYDFPIYSGSLDFIPAGQIQTLWNSADQLMFKTYYECFPLGDNFWKNVLINSSAFIGYYTFLSSLTHEEGHRSVLTYKGIGTISQPHFNSLGAAYVKGVKDETLKNIRDTDFTSFIRMHTAGIENDYILMQTDFEQFVFNGHNNSLYMPSLADYISRDMAVFSYLNIFFSVDSPSDKKIMTEETNELERDIVGHDVYGMIHHLFNPTAEYHRYWDPCEMSKEELDYGKKIGLLALLDLPLFSPLIWTGNAGIDIGKNHQISFTTGYALTPFGDMIDERFYYGYYGFENPIRVSFYARQYGNRYKYFPAFGIKLIQYSPISWLSITASGDFWIQPENLDFNTKTGKSGGAGEIKLMFFPPNQNNKNGDFGVSLGVLAKSKGFLPSVESHDDYWRISAGVSYRPKNNK